MTVLGCDDCGDTYAAGDATMMGWSAAPSSISSGYVSGGAIRLTNGATRNKTMTGLGTDFTFGQHFAFSNAGTPYSAFIEVRESSTTHFRISYNGDGTFTITRNGSALTGGVSSASVITNGVYFTLELWGLVSDTVGDFELRINGVTVATGNGSSDTKNGGTGVCTNTQYAGTTGASTHLDVDDIWWSGTATDFQGDVRAIGQLCNADGASTAWTASAGSDYQCVDDATPDGDTTYISSATPGDRFTGAWPALPVASGAAVSGVMVRNIARKDDAGTRTIASVIRRGGTNYDGTTTANLSTSYQAYEQFYVQDPSTAAAWTVANVDAGEYGVKCVA